MNMFGMGIFLTLTKYFSNPQQIMQESAYSKTDLDFLRNRALSALILIYFVLRIRLGYFKSWKGLTDAFI